MKVLFLFILGVSIITKKFVTTSNKMSIATYEEVKNVILHPETTLIDVREPNELSETGVIPTSINIPLSKISNALSSETSPETFEKLYGHKKPEFSDELIFSCRTGRRSGMALAEAVNLGFSNVKNYKGSWIEWAEKEGLPK